MSITVFPKDTNSVLQGSRVDRPEVIVSKQWAQLLSYRSVVWSHDSGRKLFLILETLYAQGVDTFLYAIGFKVLTMLQHRSR